MKNINKKSGNYLDRIVLDKEELTFEDALMKGEYISVKDIKKSKKTFEKAVSPIKLF